MITDILISPKSIAQAKLRNIRSESTTPQEKDWKPCSTEEVQQSTRNSMSTNGIGMPEDELNQINKI